MGSVTQRQISLALVVAISFYLTYQIIDSLAVLKTTVSPEYYLARIALALTFFCFLTVVIWTSYSFIGGLTVAGYAAIMIFFVWGIAKSSVFLGYIGSYAGLCILFLRLDQHFENQISALGVDREKDANKINDLDVSYKVKGEGISIFFEKYSTYYNLRKLAEELSPILSVTQLARMVVQRTIEFIPRGEIVLVTLADREEKNLSVILAEPIGASSHPYSAQGDNFDFWAIKHRKRLIVGDAHEDFRFDVGETARKSELRSLIIAPLLHEGRVIGTLRINSSKSHAFSNDDLRVLDTISVLASSALSNAMLYEQTKELSIRDSLTGLYVRRYFFERLKEEHRRSLLTHRPLSLLMCDLDHFKELNDRFGHGVGDLILTHFSKTLREISENELVARYGGEEFVILLPERAKLDAGILANEIRKKIEASPITIRREKIKITVSIGVASTPEDTLDFEELVQKSDEALYQAKRLGRNKVCLSGV